jgi:hypothetical protein
MFNSRAAQMEERKEREMMEGEKEGQDDEAIAA